jgi:hypothetical protein
MILLYSENLLIRDSATGELTTLDTKRLSQRLNAAFAACGITEEWIAENLTAVLERRIQACAKVGFEFSTTDIERCLQTVLNDTGFRDVALVFTWQSPSDNQAPEYSPLMTFQPELLDCAQVPPQLQLQTRYIKAEDWQLDCDDTCRELLSAQILRVLPSSDIIPIAVINCDLLRLLPPERAALFELEFAVSLGRACAAARALLHQMHQQLRATWPEIIQPGTHLRFVNFKEFLNTYQSLLNTAGEPRGLAAELGRCLNSALNATDREIPFSYSCR